MTTCPSGVHYMHLVDHARRYVEERFTRPAAERVLRAMLAWLLPRPQLFRLGLAGARLLRPLARIMPGRLEAMFTLAPATLPPPSRVDRPQVFPATGDRRARVALLSGCVQQVMAPQINEATVRLLQRHGVEVVVAKGAGCCGALTHHLGRETPALQAARANIAAWHDERDRGGLDAVVINASGCGTTIKDYGFMFRDDPVWHEKAKTVAGLAKDITEFMSNLGLAEATVKTGQAVAYHSACSMQHGQAIRTEPAALLRAAGFVVRDIPEGHLCCGSAGTYNLMQPEIANRLRDRKVGNIESVAPDIIAAGNIGCLVQIGGATRIPVVHTVELLDWATGGPRPAALS